MKYLFITIYAILSLSSCSTFQCEKDAEGNCVQLETTGLLDHGGN